MTRFLITLISSCFFVGYLPFIPGTFGSVAGLVLVVALRGHPALHLAVALFVGVLGFAVSGRAERISGRKDNSTIVIDEVCGMLLCVVWLPWEPRLIALAFLLFRLLDTVKPYPANRLQELEGSLGVMSDDIVAAVYTNIILQVVVRLASLTAS